jgi:hypothetical protein
VDRGLRANFVFNTIKDASEANRLVPRNPKPSTPRPKTHINPSTLVGSINPLNRHRKITPK